MKKQRDIRIETINGPGYSLLAHVFGPIAAHKEWNGRRGSWTVTHVPTGMAFERRLTREEALRLARRLARDPFWLHVRVTREGGFGGPAATAEAKAHFNAAQAEAGLDLLS